MRSLQSVVLLAKHWYRAVSGPFVAAISLVVEHATGRPLSWSGFVALCSSGMAWHLWSQLKEERKLRVPQSLPVLTLGYDRSFGSDLEYSGFYLRVEGEFRASNVHINSEETVGHAHKRIYMRWKDPSNEIGRERVPVEVTCIFWVNDVPHPCGGMAKYQIDNFFKGKKNEPKELIVTVSFTDMQGNACPLRKFMITESFENVLRERAIISCQPMKVQATS
jgi:hypothetical protein